MLIVYSQGVLAFDMRTDKPSGSAWPLCKDANTQIVWGNIHTRVTLLDIDVELYLPSTFLTGTETDAADCRELALAELMRQLTFEDLQKLLNQVKVEGRRQGIATAQATMRKALGL